MLYTLKLKFTHFVVAKIDGSIFASARDEANRIYNFLISSQTGTVSQQVNNSFRPLDQERADFIRRKAERSYGKLPVYRVPRFEFS